MSKTCFLKIDSELQKKSATHGAITEFLQTSSFNDIGVLNDLLLRLAQEVGEEIYSTFLATILGVEFSATEAKYHWTKIVELHLASAPKFEGEVDFRVSALHYFITVAGILTNPVIIEAQTLEKTCQEIVTDELTGLYNYRHFQDTLARELERADRHQSELSLLFLDIDHFKRVNDQYGHSVGDEALKLVSRAIQSSIRSIDIAFRYGGEEFAVIAPETSKEGAMILAERIREKVKGMSSFALKKIQHGVTVSVGVASFPADARMGKDLLERADQALYQAKQKGRNRVEVMHTNQRRFRRRSVDISQAYVHVAKNKWEATLKNVSEGGFLMSAEQKLELGSVVEMEIYPPNESAMPIRCIGQVVHIQSVGSENQFDLGISIFGMSSGHRERYTTLLLGDQAA